VVSRRNPRKLSMSRLPFRLIRQVDTLYMYCVFVLASGSAQSAFCSPAKNLQARDAARALKFSFSLPYAYGRTAGDRRSSREGEREKGELETPSGVNTMRKAPN
jgi:hypothetical protein